MSTNAPKQQQQQQYARDPRYQAQYARKVVIDYLHKHGYKAAEKELSADSKDQDADAMYDDESRNAVMMLNRATRGFEDQPAMYEEMYKELRDWVDGSLDMYKGELHSVLYPHLVHCFLEMVRRGASRSARRFLERYGNEFLAHSEKRAEELRTLMGVTTPQIMSENETAKLFLNNRYELYLSSYALELLLAFLTDNPRRYLLLRILNHKCRIIDQTIPSAANGVEEKTGFFASQEQNALLHKGVLWGRLKEEEYIIADDTGEKDKEEEEEDDEAKDKAPQVEPDGTLSKSPVPIPKYRVGAQGLDALSPSQRGRVPLSRSALPSCLFYTFANTRGCAMNCVAVSPDASLVAAGFQESSVRVWDYKGGQTNGTKLVGHSGPVFSVDLSFCGRYLLSGSEDGTVRLWSIPLKADLVSFRGHNHPVWSVAWGGYGHYFASASHDSTARIWSTDRISPLRILSGHLSDVDSVVWHPNSNYVATGSTDLTSRLWDVRVGECVRVFGTHLGPLHTLAFSPSGKYLAMSGSARDIHVWDIAQCKQVLRLKGHEGPVWHLAYSCEGSILASASADQTVRLWDVTTGSDGHKLADSVLSVPIPGAVNGEAGNGAPAAKGGQLAGADAAKPLAGAAPTAAAAPGVGATGTQSTSEAAAPAAAGAASGVPARPASKADSPLLATLRTKKTPVYYVRFTRKNLLVAGGAYGC